jgi:hypothetical protein
METFSTKGEMVSNASMTCREISAQELAGMMLELQAMGYNINRVSPSHVVAQVIAAVAIAADKGLRLPLLYNTGGYDSLEALPATHTGAASRARSLDGKGTVKKFLASIPKRKFCI